MIKRRRKKQRPQNQRPCWIINQGVICNFNPMRIEEVHMAIVEGKAAPAFTLPDAKGEKVSLKDFKGKNVVVYFYPKDDTPG
jgi:peroxiredoxin